MNLRRRTVIWRIVAEPDVRVRIRGRVVAVNIQRRQVRIVRVVATQKAAHGTVQPPYSFGVLAVLPPAHPCINLTGGGYSDSRAVQAVGMDFCIRANNLPRMRGRRWRQFSFSPLPYGRGSAPHKGARVFVLVFDAHTGAEPDVRVRTRGRAAAVNKQRRQERRVRDVATQKAAHGLFP